MAKNEKRLIDANAVVAELKENVCKNCNSHNGIRCDYCWADDVIDFLQEAPTIDAVEVVRCKDCKHYDNSEGICWCKLNSKFFPGGLDWHGFPEDGFCSYGERREGE